MKKKIRFLFQLQLVETAFLFITYFLSFSVGRKRIKKTAAQYP